MMAAGGARRGGMPLYKWLGNRILTGIQNRLLKTNFSEFHSGYRIYSVRALAGIPFDKNTNDFHFDTEIIIQLVRAGLRIKELPIPTYYGDEICHVNGLKYALDVVRVTLLSRAQDLGILYERKFDLAPPGQQYLPKWGYESPHELAVQRVPSGSKVADLGCASGYVARALFEKGCDVTGVDQYRPPADAHVSNFIQANLDGSEIPVDVGEFDYVLLLDVIEHLRSPETFVESLRNSRRQDRDTRVIVSTGNVAFIVTRLMLLSGFFHYGARGILDLTHTRLFTFATIRKLFEQANYRIEEIRGIPAPIPLALGDTALARFLVEREPVPDQDFAIAVFLPDLPGRHTTSIFGSAARRGDRFWRVSFGGSYRVGTGSHTSRHAPPSRRFAAVISPPCCVTIPCATVKPSPVPRASRRVVTKASKISGSTSAGMPGPLSSTAMAIPGSPARSTCRARTVDGTTRNIDRVHRVAQHVHEHLNQTIGIADHAFFRVD